MKDQFEVYHCYFLGAQRSYNSLSDESKHVARAGSARIVTLRTGVPLGIAGDCKALRYTGRGGSVPVVEVGDTGGVNCIVLLFRCTGQGEE